jgi:polyisoprenoid-binding protein YceI
MKNLIIAIALVVGCNTLHAQNAVYKLKTLNTNFVIKNAGLNVKGDFKTGSATLSVDEKKIENSKFSGTVKANSIRTGNKLRDTHLIEKAEFFNTAKYADIKLESTKIVALGDGKYNVTWALTIKDVKKSITVPLSATLVGGVLNLASSFTINRRDWNVGEKSIMMNDNVKINLVATATK